jgi:hypothetical protein
VRENFPRQLNGAIGIDTNDRGHCKRSLRQRH